ncbi:MAG: protein translocase subunit SecF [Clostridia bacterium]
MFIQFTKHRKLWYVISSIVIIAGIISMLIPGRGLNLGIDFKGGTLINLEFAQTVKIADVRTVLDSAKISAQLNEAGAKGMLIRVPVMTEAENTALISKLGTELGDFTVKSNENVSAIVGKELTNKAILAVIIASLLMAIYITFRFEFLFGISAVLSLLHDVLIMIGLFSIFQWEVNSTFIAAMLTIIGYSINDTIVNFDRIRENRGYQKKESDAEVVDKSINQCLVRSITTAATVWIALVCLLAFGGESIKMFTLAMLIGTVAGAYSSIFVAAPLWLDFEQLWGNKLHKSRKRK